MHTYMYMYIRYADAIISHNIFPDVEVSNSAPTFHTSFLTYNQYFFKRSIWKVQILLCSRFYSHERYYVCFSFIHSLV